MEIRSYRRVFDLERRVYSVDSLKLNPGGVPVRGILYFATILAVGVLGARLPLLSSIARATPWYLRDIVLPGAVATVLGMLRVEGRTFHLAALAIVRFWVRPRRLAGLRRRASVGERWNPEQILFLPDGSEASMRRLRYTGPGAVLVAVEHDRADRARGVARWLGAARAALVLEQRAGARAPSSGQVILLGAGVRMLVRSAASGKERR